MTTFDPPPATTDATSAGCDRTDWREQLYNQGEAGPVTRVRLPTAAVTRRQCVLFGSGAELHRLVFMLRSGCVKSRHNFHVEAAGPWLPSNTRLIVAEVVSCAGGRRSRIPFDGLRRLKVSGERSRKAKVVRRAGRTNSTNSPVITAMTRHVGNWIGKEGVMVEFLVAGRRRLTRSLAPSSNRQAARGTPVAELFRVAEVAECVAISRSKLYAMMDAGELPYVKIGRSKRLSAAAVAELVESCRVRR